MDFSATVIEPEMQVPKALFDGVAENLLQNAIAKRSGGRTVRIQVTMVGGAAPELRVCDSGAAVTPEVVSALFHAPVNSSAGLGIGLYQAARHAETSGYALTLVENHDGAVCFALRRTGADKA